MLKTGGDLLHGHVFEAEFAQGSTRLDKIEGDFDHWISRQVERHNRVSMLMENDRDGA